MSNLVFALGNLVAIVGGLMALVWVTTNKRYYWRRKRRGAASLVFIAVGAFLMVSAANGFSAATESHPATTASCTTNRGGC